MSFIDQILCKEVDDFYVYQDNKMPYSLNEALSQEGHNMCQYLLLTKLDAIPLIWGLGKKMIENYFTSQGQHTSRRTNGLMLKRSEEVREGERVFLCIL